MFGHMKALKHLCLYLQMTILLEFASISFINGVMFYPTHTQIGWDDSFFNASFNFKEEIRNLQLVFWYFKAWFWSLFGNPASHYSNCQVRPTNHRPVKKLRKCEIKWQSPKVPAVTNNINTTYEKKLLILPNSKSLHSHCTQHIGKEARKRRRQKQEQAKAKAREARGRNKEDIGIVEPRLCSSSWLLLYSRAPPPPRHAAAATSRTNERTQLSSSSRGLEAESRKSC